MGKISDYLFGTIQGPPVNRAAEVPGPGVAMRAVALGEIVSNFEIIDSDDGYMIVTPVVDETDARMGSVGSTVSLAEPPMFSELGHTGQSLYGGYLREEYNADLRDQLGLQKYDRMRRNDSSVRSSLRLFKTPILSARWFVQPASDSPQDRKIAKFIEDNLFKWMSISWPQVLWEALLMLDYGYYMFEKVYDVRFIDGEPRLIWKKFAPRHPLDATSWKWDENGGPLSVSFFGGLGKPPITIPISKLAVFSFDREGGDIRGISALRSAYKHWYFKENLYKIDAIQKERHGIGIPIIKLPPGFTPGDRATAQELGRNLRTNEKAHVVLPPMWDIMFAKLEGQPVNALESAEHHGRMIFQNILGEFMSGDIGANSGEIQKEMFLKSTKYIAEIVRDVFNKYCIPELVNWNWPDIENYPELRVRRIGDTQDWRMISFALRNLVGAQIIKPDDELDKWIRDEMDLPMADPKTEREPPAPQNPGSGGGVGGSPRQSQAGRMQLQPGSRAGSDGNGQSGGGN